MRWHVLRLLTAEILQFLGFALGELNDLLGEIGQLSDVNTETLVAHARLDLVQERDVIFLPPLGLHVDVSVAIHTPRCDFSADVEVVDVRKVLVEYRELVKVRCEEAETPDLGCDVPAQY